MADGVFEMHGVWASGGKDTKGKWIDLREIGADRVQISYHGIGGDPLLSANQARYLGLKLLRLARRIEARSGA